MSEETDLTNPRTVVGVVVRVLVAVIFVASGGVKLIMYSEQLGLFIEWGVPFAEVLVVVVGVIEVAAGVAVFVGFLARVSATVLSTVMVGAFLTAGPNGLNILSFVLCVITVVNGVGGPYVLSEQEAIEEFTDS